MAPASYLNAKSLDLRVVDSSALLSHEDHDRQRSLPLVEALKRDGLLKNPPVVTPTGLNDGQYVMLDGANRIFALEALGIPHTLVQVVPYEEPHVELLTWYHVVCDIPAATLRHAIESVEGVTLEPASLTHARGLLSARAILAYYVQADGEVLTIAGGGLDLHERNRLLNGIAGSYMEIGTLYRNKTDSVSELLSLYPGLTGAIIYPKYAPEEILDLAHNGMRVPPGLTRHIVHGRALRLNYPLERLGADISLEEKNIELQQWIQHKFQNRMVRYYAESTYLFDE